MNHRILPFACLLTVVACSNRQVECVSSSEIFILGSEVDTVKRSDPGQAYRDSISMLTGIGYGPYWYDPSWELAYSKQADTLLYYPRDRKNAYFTMPASVRVIEERAFQCNKNLKEITIPEGVEILGTGAFLWSEKLQTVTIRGRIDTLYWRTFDGCPELHSVELPWSVKSIDGMAFINCGKLRRIVIRNPEPPTLEGYEPDEEDGGMWAFNGVNTERCVLQVPYGSVKKYREAPGWSRFKHIEENIKPIPHRWVELDSTLLAGYSITPEDIEHWKRRFNRKFVFDYWDAAHLKYYNGEDRYIAIKDLQNLWFYERPDSITKGPCTLWRIFQYAVKSRHQIPETITGQARLVRSQIDSVLSYEAMSNADMGNKNALEEYLFCWYYNLLAWQIESAVSPELKALLEQEDTAWNEYHELAMKAFKTVSDCTGSGFPIWYYEFGTRDLVLRIIGTEALYATVFPDAKLPRSFDVGNNATVKEEQVLAGYHSFNYPHWDLDEWSFSIGLSTVSQMKVALRAERESWERWMAIREDISDILRDAEKETWDNATNNIRRRKIYLLKEGYNMF